MTPTPIAQRIAALQSIQARSPLTSVAWQDASRALGVLFAQQSAFQPETAMQTWTNIDKSKYPTRGAWDTEPDKAQWIAHGFDCLILRGPVGALCGYVGVPQSHPYFEKGYGDCVAPDRHEAHEGGEDDWHHNCTPGGMLDVHGGLTFAAKCQTDEQDDDPGKHICHTGNVANKEVWWFGFDCAHCDDVCPGMDRQFAGHGESYRGFEYVKQEVESLAQQLARAA